MLEINEQYIPMLALRARHENYGQYPGEMRSKISWRMAWDPLSLVRHRRAVSLKSLVHLKALTTAEPESPALLG